MTERFDKLLVLDIDETLVHGTEEPLARAPDFLVGPFSIYKRPGVDAFPDWCLGRFEVGVWTCATAGYAVEVMAALLGDASRLAFLWARDRCTRRVDIERREEYWRKNLNKLKKKWPLEKVIAVDNTARNFEQSYGNLVLVRAYRGEPADSELALLMQYLPALAAAENVRAVEKRRWRENL